jgi:hypothetical protein
MPVGSIERKFIMKDRLAWEYMVTILSGHKYEPIDADKFARIAVNGVGTITDSHQHMKLTNRLYTPTAAELFDAK